MQVQYREIRGGFECLHMPSIDLASVIADAQAHQQQPSESGSRRITRKASKLSFGPRRKDKDTGSVREDKQLPTQPAVAIKDGGQDEQGEQQGNNVTSVSGGSSSFFNIIPSQELPDQQQQPTEPTEPVAVKTNGSTHSLQDLPEQNPGTAVVPQEQDPNLLSPSQSAQAGANSTPVSPTRNKFLPPIPRDFAVQQKQEQQKTQGMSTSKSSGAGGYNAPPTAFVGPPTPTPGSGPGGSITIDDLFEMSSGSELVVRFEINILKVPLLPLHGIQFRRVGGDGWQYQMLARRVLTELKL